jgi:hypothetical protein
MNCPKCGEPGILMSEIEQTLVGYFSPPGHDHDDNCLIRHVKCKNNHWWRISLRRKCSNPNCNWKGKETCFCHQGKKLDEWPEVK